MKVIRSRDNPCARQLIALAHSSRERRKQGLTVLDGIHLVRAYIEALGAPRAIAIAESALAREEVMQLLTTIPAVTVAALADTVMAEASALESPAFVMATVTTPSVRATASDANVLVLDDLQDPGNVGSLLRSAAAAGVAEIVLSKTTAFAWSPKVLRAAQGAHFSLNIVEGIDTLHFLQAYAGQSIALVPRAPSAKALFEIDFKRPTAIVIGNEGAGLPLSLQQATTHRVTIPMPGKMESLNAAAAGAISLFEMVRQRGDAIATNTNK